MLLAETTPRGSSTAPPTFAIRRSSEFSSVGFVSSPKSQEIVKCEPEPTISVTFTFGLVRSRGHVVAAAFECNAMAAIGTTVTLIGLDVPAYGVITAVES